MTHTKLESWPTIARSESCLERRVLEETWPSPIQAGSLTKSPLSITWFGVASAHLRMKDCIEFRQTGQPSTEAALYKTGDISPAPRVNGDTLSFYVSVSSKYPDFGRHGGRPGGHLCPRSAHRLAKILAERMKE